MVQSLAHRSSPLDALYHSNMDNIDHLVEDDLKQAATVIASFVMHTAMCDEKLPRKIKELKARSN